MATSNTTNLNLIKETNTEPIVNHRGHFNDNMDLIDAAYNTLASRSRGQQTWGNLKQNTTWGELIGTNVVSATTTTNNLELIQPGYDSTVDVESFNDNMSILDSTIGAIDVTNDGSIADQLSSVRDSLDETYVLLTPYSSKIVTGNSHAHLLVKGNHVYAYVCDFSDSNVMGSSEKHYLIPEQYCPQSNVTLVAFIRKGDGTCFPTNATAYASGYIGQGQTSSCCGMLAIGEWPIS